MEMVMVTEKKIAFIQPVVSIHDLGNDRRLLSEIRFI